MAKNDFRARKRAKKFIWIFTIILVIALCALIFFALYGHKLAERAQESFEQSAASTSSSDDLPTDESAPSQSTSELNPYDTSEQETSAEQGQSTVTHGIYTMDFDSFESLDVAGFESYINNVKLAGFTQIAVPVKYFPGIVTFETSSEVAANSGAIQPFTTPGMDKIVGYIHSVDIKVYGMIDACSDRRVTETYSQYTLLKNDGEPVMSEGAPYMNIYLPAVRDYISGICAEASGFGFDGLILSSFAFPMTAEPEKILYLNDARTKAIAAADFVSDIRRAMDSVNPEVKLYLAFSDEMAGQTDITGIDREKLETIADGIAEIDEGKKEMRIDDTN